MVIACDVSNMASANNGGGPANDNARGSVTLLVNGEPAASGSPAAAAAAALPSLPASPPQTLALSPTSASSAVPSDAGPCTVAAAVQKLKEEEKKVQLVSKVMRRRNTKRQITRWWVRVGSYVVRNGLPSNSNERLNTEKPRFCPPFSKSMRTQVKSSKGEQAHARLCTYVLCIFLFYLFAAASHSRISAQARGTEEAGKHNFGASSNRSSTKTNVGDPPLFPLRAPI